MKKTWVVLLSALAFGAGAFGTMAYIGAEGSTTSFRIACELLNTAEVSNILTTRQRADIVDKVLRQLQPPSGERDVRIDQFGERMKSGCPNLPRL